MLTPPRVYADGVAEEHSAIAVGKVGRQALSPFGHLPIPTCWRCTLTGVDEPIARMGSEDEERLGEGDCEEQLARAGDELVVQSLGPLPHPRVPLVIAGMHIHEEEGLPVHSESTDDAREAVHAAGEARAVGVGEGVLG